MLLKIRTDLIKMIMVITSPVPRVYDEDEEAISSFYPTTRLQDLDVVDVLSNTFQFLCAINLVQQLFIILFWVIVMGKHPLL